MKTAILAAAFLVAAPLIAGAGIHPTFHLLDAQEEETGDPGLVDAGATCGQCHDVGFIRTHSAHHARHLAVDCFRCHVPGGPEVLIEEHLEDGEVRYQMETPANDTCGSCHGLVPSLDRPVELPADYPRSEDPSPTAWTLRTGWIFSGQRISDSFLNLTNKDDRDRPWDVHAARKLDCTSCHFAANNPARAGLAVAVTKGHLRRDPRTLEVNEYVTRPDHRLAAANCTACHDAAAAHPEMPYRARHMEALACEACHVPDLAAPAARVVDATVVTSTGGPRLEFRGIDDPAGRPNTWYGTGYQPFLLYEADRDRFAPYNVVARWAWVGRGGTPVPDEVVRAAWFTGDGVYHPDLISRFDRDGDGTLTAGELLLDTPERVAAVAGRLEALGIDGPEIHGEVDAEPVRHGVVEGRWVGGRCDTCHSRRSRLNVDVPVAAGAFPGGIAPEPSEALEALLGARTLETVEGRTMLQGSSAPTGRYVPGMSRPWTDLVGILFFALTLVGITIHGLRRVLAARRRRDLTPAPATRREYLYNAYERLWHWVMAFSVLLLLFSGLHVHFPDGPGLLSFPTAVLVHNVMAAVMLVNAFLALFYHLSTSEIRQFIPAGAGFVGRLKAQARYYLHGIFRGAAHPTGKSRERKLNPLQQLTYVGLLNILFPLQIGTGVLLWTAGLAPGMVAPLGGLAVVTPIHNLGSWLFLSFLVAHIYLTTTGHTPLSNLQAMVGGWDEIEVAPTHAAKGADA